MYPKKLLILQILEILRRFSDDRNPLTQAQIAELLRRHYGVACDRKSVKRNIDALLDMNIDLGSQSHPRRLGDGEETVAHSSWHYIHEFTEAELHLIINSILFSRSIPTSQCLKLIEKLKGLASVHFDPHEKHIRPLPCKSIENKQLLFTIEMLDEAIDQQRQVVFNYLNYGVDKKPYVRKTKSGEPQIYTANPYHMAVANGRHYLICTTEPACKVFHLRLDRIANIEITDTSAKPRSSVKELNKALPEYLAEHIYMFTGDRVKAEFLIDEGLIIDVLDWFGADATMRKSINGKVRVKVDVNEQAMFFWALQYGLSAEIIKPEGLRARLRAAAEEMAKKYSADSSEQDV